MLIATVLALGAAVLHAGWNLRIKQSGDRWLALWGLFSAGGLIGLPYAVVATVTGDLGWSAWGWATASGAVHAFYIGRLAKTYDVADFSVTYPIARGGGALFAAIGGVLFLSDHLSPVSIIGILIVVGGLVLLAGHVDWAHVWPALIVGLLIGAYTVIDSKGSRSTVGSAYAMAIFVTGGIGTTIQGVFRKRWTAMRASIAPMWKQYALTGLASLVTYWMVLLAVRRAPVGYVTALRESSVVFATFIGWKVLKESSGVRRLVSSAVMVVGLVT
ncbi:MAG: EamA family transporter, partial [Ilumatobacteraceae bacterium]